MKFAVKPIIAGTLGGPLDGTGGVVPKKDELPPHGAVSIDCGTMAGFFCPTSDGICFDFTAIDGFVKIQSTDKLGVVAIYTARPEAGEVSTMDVETVEGHELVMEVDAYDMPEPPVYEPKMRMRGAYDIRRRGVGRLFRSDRIKPRTRDVNCFTGPRRLSPYPESRLTPGPYSSVFHWSDFHGP